jgi:hypothetical protein
VYPVKELEFIWKKWVAAVRKVYNPHSAPPSVTIGNFGFLNTFDDNFDTKSSKS